MYMLPPKLKLGCPLGLSGFTKPQRDIHDSAGAIENKVLIGFVSQKLRLCSRPCLVLASTNELRGAPGVRSRPAARGEEDLPIEAASRCSADLGCSFSVFGVAV
jgi:hypothetical protein